MPGYEAPFALVSMYICSRPFVFASLCLVWACIYITSALVPNVFYPHCEFRYRSYDCLFAHVNLACYLLHDTEAEQTWGEQAFPIR